MHEALDLSLFVTRTERGLAHMELAVEGVGCASCIRKIESGLRETPGVADARLNFSERRLSIDWQDDRISAGDVVRTIERIGYRAYPFRPDRAESEDAQYARWLLKCLAVAGFAAMNVMLLSVSVWSGHVSDMPQETRDFFHWLSALIALPAAAYAGQPFFRNAWHAVRAGQVNMDVPISVGVVLALGMSLVETATHAQHAYFDSAIMLLFFLLCGRYLDHAMRRKMRTTAGNLAALKADVAHRLDDSNEVVTVPATALKPGDRLLVRPGERIPADGVVLGGRSEIDQSVITGETARQTVASGANVYAGSLNYSGALTVRVISASGGTLIDDVQRLLDNAIQSRSRVVRLADRAAALYAPVVHAAAALTVLGWLLAGASWHDAVVTGIAVLIVTCPCALALAIPAVQVVTSGKLFKSGVILNADDVIERMADVDTVVFDKTGTLTLPEPRVENAAMVDPETLECAARLALSSRHPLAVALAREARRRIPFEGAVEEPGQGVRAMVDGREMRLGSAEFCSATPDARIGEPEISTIHFAWGEATTRLNFRQKLRPDAVATIAGLAALGIELHILSGDRPQAVESVANALRIASWEGGRKPADKIAFIEALKFAGRRVLMVGDGLNDAPALAAAQVSMSPVSAAHMTQAQADAVFLGERLGPILQTVLACRQARRIMTQNLWLAVIYNVIAVPIAVAGLLTPLIAAAAMSGSSVLVTLNALRAQRTAQPDDVPEPESPQTRGLPV